MVKFFYWPFFFLSVFISINSTNWIGVWLGMELNLFSFIMLSFYFNQYSSECCLSYYLVQVISSIFFVFFVFFIDFFYVNFILFVMGVSVASAPFHYWGVLVSGGFKDLSFYFFLTIQSLVPFYFSFNFFNLYLIYFFVFFSIFGILGSINQVYLYQVLFYSSVGHMGWMFFSLFFSFFYFFLYLFVYSLNIFMFISSSFYNIIKVFVKGGFYIVFLFLSLGGMPPFFGFYMKWLIIVESYGDFILFFLIFGVMFNLYVYLRFIYSSINFFFLSWFSFFDYYYFYWFIFFFLFCFMYM
uniref:NADH-ubiquinone oxidoreductase chain 2 n=1 Tax=Sinentomon erythranum TaxID=289455 RepID=G3D5P1_9HEXA|nr:NADH dehydrogenase subunit 2 [Sinentomon erythranum]ADN32968.1 NADH dehydrogenase subunit 2 [Sinentomon erythranum]